MKELEELVPQLETLMDARALAEQATQQAQDAAQAAEQRCATLESQVRLPLAELGTTPAARARAECLWLLLNSL